MFKNMKLSTKLISTYFLVGVLPLATVGIIAWLVASTSLSTVGTQGSEALEEGAYDQLKALRDIKTEQIANYFREREGDMGVLEETVGTLRREALAKLTAVREIKKAQIEKYFGEREGDMGVLVETVGTLRQEAIAKMIRALRDDAGQLPSAVTVPEHIWNDGNFPWPGQDAGFLGRRRDPWLIHCQPQEDKFDFPGLSLAADTPAIRFDSRRKLLDQMNDASDQLAASGPVGDYSLHARKALDLLTGSSARAAFDLSQESAATRDRYGPSRFAQSCLLARR